ncbi:chemotaxis protein CheD [Paucidesulfovibrio gracilis DSM 16080]|uniref:Probable chemoreceptor glutamine deamidase CheD n=1 Tax=Paucidesulfovibrio gracilis DSM 16080 TaxID=1121449 RepID=A0A1T4XJW1_9BACT|nr:chemotaxis protein CheD [Paucidesulfovibrio gracilis]SKA89784.1 chemotaxis protein CheD [Paucidesulfovibrio gracilis DSM 16080]
MKDRQRQVMVSDVMLGAGYVCVPAEPSRLCAVVGAGAVVTIWDRRRAVGGMTHYARPFRDPGGPSTAIFAAPAIVTLVRMLLKGGSNAPDLEAHLFGGADNPEAPGYASGMAEDNVRVGLEILEKLHVTRVQRDTGGQRGRKVVFHTATGEVMLAKVERIRGTDWYPQ